MRAVVVAGLVASAATAVAAPYVLPAKVADALAAEQLAGNVLVPEGVTLYATKDAALASTEKPKRGEPRAMTVIRDHGAVVELSTAPTKDCAKGFEHPYELTVFVKREHLYLRTKVEVTRTFSDSSAVAIDRGAAVELGATGLVWQERRFTETAVLPAEDQLSYAVPAGAKPTALPALTGDRLVCEGDQVMTAAQYRQRKKSRVKNPPPPCWVDPNIANAPKPVVNGATVRWPSTFDASIVRAGGRNLADIADRCGRVRMIVDLTSIAAVPVLGGFGGSWPGTWVPGRGPVTWYSGAPAGKYTGTRVYVPDFETPDVFCVRERGLDEPICHPKKTAKRAKARTSPYGM